MEFEEYVALRHQSLLRLAFILCRDADHAEDLVQTALVSAFKHWRRVRKADHPDAYVRRTLVNAYLAWVRKASSGERTTESHALEALAGAGRHDHADEVAARDEVRRGLDGLAPRARIVIALRYYADLDDAAIAATLGITTSTVRATASRALATLREQAAHAALSPADARPADARPAEELR